MLRTRVQTRQNQDQDHYSERAVVRRPVTPLRPGWRAAATQTGRGRSVAKAPQAYKPNPVLTTSPVVGFKMTGT
jgi:hypothetical protein